MQYTEIFKVKKKRRKFSEKNRHFFLIFAQNIDCGYTFNRLGEGVLTSTDNLCFGAKIRKIGIPLRTSVLSQYIKVGYKGVYVIRTRFPDEHVTDVY